jgi:hypothetical protein
VFIKTSKIFVILIVCTPSAGSMALTNEDFFRENAETAKKNSAQDSNDYFGSVFSRKQTGA